jgi:hypothetical protein
MTFLSDKKPSLRSLEKLPNYEGIVCRNDKYIDNKAWIDSHIKGQIITYPFFMSTSKRDSMMIMMLKFILKQKR